MRINDKHIGVIIRQMMKKVEIVDVGDTPFIYGQQVDRFKFHEENRKIIREGGQPAIARPHPAGHHPGLPEHRLVAAPPPPSRRPRGCSPTPPSRGACDHLRGLKENVIIGHLIPAGTGMKKYREIKLYDENMEDLDISVNRIIEEKRKERELKAMLQEARRPAATAESRCRRRQGWRQRRPLGRDADAGAARDGGSAGP